VPDSDAVYAKALKADGKSIAALEDQFYGDRAGAAEDPEGNKWWIASRKEIVPPEVDSSGQTLNSVSRRSRVCAAEFIFLSVSTAFRESITSPFVLS
jgi:hypothetical protein